MKVLAVAAVSREAAPTFDELLTRLYRDKHTGPVIVHFGQGVANTVEIPRESVRISLDRRRD